MRLTTLMAEENLLQIQIAQNANISRSVISKLLRGISQPSLFTIDRLMAAYPALTSSDIFADFDDARRKHAERM